MKNIRPLGWVIIVINSYLILNFFLTIDQNNSDAVNGFAFIFLMFVLAIIDVPLYILYRVTGKKKRECPACGSKVPVGLTVCEKCLFDFRKKANGDLF
jgi:hypothetical protein